MTDDILVDVDAAGIAVVTLNRPKKRNAVSLAMWRDLAHIYAGFIPRSDVRVVILTGGGGNFCGGADISEFSTVRNSVDDARVYGQAGRDATQAIIDLPQPTIAAVHGYGVGGGCGLALACDLRVGDATTQMGIPAARALDRLRQAGLQSADARCGVGECEAGALLGSVLPLSGLPRNGFDRRGVGTGSAGRGA